VEQDPNDPSGATPDPNAPCLYQCNAVDTPGSPTLCRRTCTRMHGHGAQHNCAVHGAF